jgi:hypothetical protein
MPPNYSQTKKCSSHSTSREMKYIYVKLIARKINVYFIIFILKWFLFGGFNKTQNYNYFNYAHSRISTVKNFVATALWLQKVNLQ